MKKSLKKFGYFFPKWINWINIFFQNVKKQYSDEKERERRRSLSLAAAKGDKKAFDALKDESVDYLIQTLSQNPERLEDYDIVYDSDGFVVYKIN